MEALPFMHSLLNARPDGFNNVEEAIEWQYVVKHK
jgi:protein phosphatase methylesterase 1